MPSLLSQATSKPARQTFSLYFAQMSIMLLGLITVPLITRALGPAEYGRYSLVIAILTFVGAYYEFGFFSAGSRLLATEKNPTKERELIGSLMLVGLAIALLFVGTIFGISFFIDAWLGSDVATLLRIIALPAGLFPFQFMAQQIAQGANRIYQLALLTILPGAVMLCGVLLLNHYADLTPGTVLGLNAAGWFLFTIGFQLSFKPLFSHGKERLATIWKETKEYGRDVYLGRAIGITTFDLDKLFITRFVNTTSVGFYSLGLLLVSPMVTLSQSLSTAIFKDLASQSRVPFKVLFYNLVWLIGASLFLILTGRWIVTLLFSAQYLPTADLLPVLVIAGLCQGLFQPYNNFLGAHGQGKYLRNIAWVYAGVNVVGNLIYIKYFGVIGAAYATLTSNLVYLSLCLYCYHTYLRKNQGTFTDYAKFTPEFFEKLYATDADPWGLNTRATQRVRYEQYLKFLKPYLKPTMRALDIGCSKGQFTKRLAPYVKHVVGIDISELAVAQAKEVAALPNVSYRVDTLPKLADKSGTYDLVMPIEVITYLTDEQRAQAYKEMARVLRPDGLLFISVNLAPKPYYEMGELLEAVSRDFDIIKVQRRYNKLYNLIEGKLLMFAETPLRGVVQNFLAQPLPVKVADAMTRVILSKRGATMAYVLARKK